ncbi:MAG: hypothetical protein M1816_001876 [Peltula sp. TS41687]|nr:MAG: hypothetical protein M1816_001876 [Peltula sp. TS41687]
MIPRTERPQSCVEGQEILGHGHEEAQQAIRGRINFDRTDESSDGATSAHSLNEESLTESMWNEVGGSAISGDPASTGRSQRDWWQGSKTGSLRTVVRGILTLTKDAHRFEVAATTIMELAQEPQQRDHLIKQTSNTEFGALDADKQRHRPRRAEERDRVLVEGLTEAFSKSSLRAINTTATAANPKARSNVDNSLLQRERQAGDSS